MAQDALAVLELCRGRPPTAGEALVQQFVGAWPTFPDGDRRHDPKSGQAEHDPLTVTQNVQIVAELVLRDQVDLVQRQPSYLHPREDLFERGQVGQLTIGNHDAPSFPLTATDKLYTMIGGSAHA